jgi:predicted HTH domain antitoxin
VDIVKAVTIELPPELLQLLGSEEEAKREAKIALVLDLVRRGKLSRAKAAELLAMSLWDLQALLAQYRIPWFDYSAEDIQRDLQALRSREGSAD